jgi:hypothetical protein
VKIRLIEGDLIGCPDGRSRVRGVNEREEKVQSGKDGIEVD